MKSLSALVLVLVGCGTYSSTDYSQAPAPSDPAWVQVQPVVARNCGGCHGVKPGLPVFNSGAAFKASKAKDELTAGTMPPAGHTISADDKAALLAYLGS